MKLSIFPLLLFAVFAFSACQKDSLSKDKKTKEDYLKDYDKKDKDYCFELIYPVVYLMPDGTTITGDDEKAVWGSMKAWYEANPDSEGKPALQYPVDIKIKEGTIENIVNEEAMVALKEECKSCFELGYPITYIMPDGSTANGNDKEEVLSAMKAWYEAHPDSKEKPALQYPVNIIYKDGNTEAVGDEAAMIAIKEECEDEN